jgi:hypothetical protein
MHCAVGIENLVYSLASSCSCQYRRTFIAPLPISQSIHCAVANIAEHSLSCFLEKTTFWVLKVLALLETVSKFVHSAIADSRM